MRSPRYKVFDVYPELAVEVDGLCGGGSWYPIGASAVISDESAYYFEISRPKHWVHTESHVVVGIGCIGGNIEASEDPLHCLHREAMEEVRAPINIISSPLTTLIFENYIAGEVILSRREYPCPYLLTVGVNQKRDGPLSVYDYLIIITYYARLQKAPGLGDLFGLLRVEKSQLGRVVGRTDIPLDDLLACPGVTLTLKRELPEQVLFRPIWTAHSLCLLLQNGRLPQS